MDEIGKVFLKSISKLDRAKGTVKALRWPSLDVGTHKNCTNAHKLHITPNYLCVGVCI